MSPPDQAEVPLLKIGTNRSSLCAAVLPQGQRAPNLNAGTDPQLLHLQLLWAVPFVLLLILIFTRAALGLAWAFYHIKSSHFHLPCTVVVFHTELFYIKHLKPLHFKTSLDSHCPFPFSLRTFSPVYSPGRKVQGKTFCFSQLQTNTYPTGHNNFQYFPAVNFF